MEDPDFNARSLDDTNNSAACCLLYGALTSKGQHLPAVCCVAVSWVLYITFYKYLPYDMCGLLFAQRTGDRDNSHSVATAVTGTMAFVLTSTRYTAVPGTRALTAAPRALLHLALDS